MNFVSKISLLKNSHSNPSNQKSVHVYKEPIHLSLWSESKILYEKKIKWKYRNTDFLVSIKLFSILFDS